MVVVVVEVVVVVVVAVNVPHVPHVSDHRRCMHAEGINQTHAPCERACLEYLL